MIFLVTWRDFSILKNEQELLNLSVLFFLLEEHPEAPYCLTSEAVNEGTGISNVLEHMLEGISVEKLKKNDILSVFTKTFVSDHLKYSIASSSNLSQLFNPSMSRLKALRKGYYEHTRALCCSRSSFTIAVDLTSLSQKHLLYGTKPLVHFWRLDFPSTEGCLH